MNVNPKRRVRARQVCGALLLGLAAWVGRGSAAEIHSNGLGGGTWSDPGTWRGRAVPGSNDVVAVAGDDQVVVDLVDTNRVSCRELMIDPRGMLSFQKGGARTGLIVNGPVDSYGAIWMDLAGPDDGAAELRLVAANPPGRYLRIRRGGSIVVNGRRDLPEGDRNVWLVSAPPRGDSQGRLEVSDQAALDLSGAGVRNLQVSGYKLDNTGATPNERFNVVGCRFTGHARVWLAWCDSAVVANNEFVDGRDFALYSQDGVLTEVRGNRIRNYSHGMQLVREVDSTIADNTVENVGYGISYLSRERSGGMIRGNVVRNTTIGYQLGNYTDLGLAGDCVASNCVTAVSFSQSTYQLVDFRVEDPPTNGVPLSLGNSSVALLNCLITTNQIQLGERPRTNWWIQSQQYLVVQVKGAVPAASQVRVRTAAPAKPLPPGALDPNVRNSPAPVGADGRTPLPQTRAALIVNAWGIGADGRYVTAPSYTLEVLGPAPAPNQPPPVLKTITVTPSDSWHRPRPNDPQPTVEVAVP